jgi:hypothetical protein
LGVDADTLLMSLAHSLASLLKWDGNFVFGRNVQTGFMKGDWN